MTEWYRSNTPWLIFGHTPINCQMFSKICKGRRTCKAEVQSVQYKCAAQRHMGSLRMDTLRLLVAALCLLWVFLFHSQHQLYSHTLLLLLKHLLNTFVSTGVKSETLTQPASVTVQPGHSLSISCTVSYSVGSYYTAYIRQPAGKGLEWIGSVVGTSLYLKDSLKNKFNVNADSSSNTVTLSGQNMQPGDTAVYYCAREPQSHREYVELYKNTLGCHSLKVL